MTDDSRNSLDAYRYGERVVPDMSDRAFRPGEARISGYVSAFLGVMSLLAVLCFRYPTWLTTAELRATYDVELLRQLLRVTLWAALGFGLFTFVRNRRKRMGAVGVLSALLALTLGGAEVPTGEVRDVPLSLGLDWLLLDLLGSAAVFIFIEKLIPRYPDQAILRPEWKLDLFYFALNHLLIGALLLVGNGFAPLAFGCAVNARLQTAVQSLPLGVQVLLLMLCADFVLYWTHRFFHETPWLWKFHAVHHCTEHMDWLAGSRSHVAEVLVDRALAMVPLYLLGPDRQALDLYVVIAAAQAVFTHANVGMSLGPLEYVFVTPQFHHWHHSSDRPAIDTNYAVHFTLFDHLFGTYHMPEAHWPIAYGTVSPLPRGFLAQLAYPFRKG